MRSASPAIAGLFWYFAGKFAMPLIAFLTGWVAIYFRRWQKRRRENSAQAWPSVQGVIVSARVYPFSETKHVHAIVQYAFFVDEYRTGKYIQEFSDEDEADDFVRQIKDKRLQIRYKQSDPDQSVLEQSVVEQHVMLAPHFG